MSTPEEKVRKGQLSEGVKFALDKESDEPTPTRNVTQEATVESQPKLSSAKKIPVTFAEMVADDGIEKEKPAKSGLARAKSARVSEAFQSLGVRRRLTQLRGHGPSNSTTTPPDTVPATAEATAPAPDNGQKAASTAKPRKLAGRTLSLRLPSKGGEAPTKSQASAKQPQREGVADGAQSASGTKTQALKRALSRGPLSRPKAAKPIQAGENENKASKWKFLKK